MNCTSCGLLEEEAEELIDVNRGDQLYCQNCYDDGIINSNMYLALYYGEQKNDRLGTIHPQRGS